MAFYIRKSIGIGPLRFNLSKNGIGVSAGVKGFRVGAGSRENYVQIGAKGLFYRKTFSSPSTRIHSIQPSELPKNRNIFEPEMEKIESRSVIEMTDSSAEELLEELNGKHKKWNIWKITAAVLAIICFTVQFNIFVLVGGIFAVIMAYGYDHFRKSTVLCYELAPKIESDYQALHDGFDSLKSCNRMWHVESEGRVIDPKYHAGANKLVKRKVVIFSKGLPPYVKANIEVPILPAGKRKLYFFPERILVYENNKVGAVSYNNLEFSTNSFRFIEEETVPRDSKIVDRTWRYTNKYGGPDKRFRNNIEIPVVLYERLMFSSATGLREYFDISATNVSGDFAAAIKKIAIYQG